MTTPQRPERFLTVPPTLPVPAGDRFARTDDRPRREMPLMRRIEVAALRPDLTVQHGFHLVPQAEAFERLVSGFARGTLLATPRGEVAIEDLLPGDKLCTSQGPQRVLWLGSTTIIPGQTGAESLLNGLIRVTAEAFGIGRPAGDVVLGPGAALLHNPPQFRAANGEGHVLSPLADFIDGDSVFRVNPPGAVKVYHLRLAKHAAVRAGGLELESFHPGAGTIERMGVNAQKLFLSLFPGVSAPRDFGAMSYPRVAREMLESLRRM